MSDVVEYTSETDIHASPVVLRAERQETLNYMLIISYQSHEVAAINLVTLPHSARSVTIKNMITISVAPHARVALSLIPRQAV